VGKRRLPATDDNCLNLTHSLGFVSTWLGEVRKIEAMDMRIVHAWPTALFLACIGSASDLTITKHYVNDPDWTILFSSGPTKEAFADYRTALQIEDVLCDDRVILPVSASVEGFRDKTTKRIPNGEIIYVVRNTDFVFFAPEDLATHRETQLTYRLPAKPKVIRVFYRIRFPDGSFSPKKLVVSQGDETDLGRLKQQGQAKGSG
jgi:hypothetical protein